MDRFECYSDVYEFMVKDNLYNIKFSIGDPTEFILRLPDKMPTRDLTNQEIYRKIHEYSRNFIDAIFDVHPFVPCRQYCVRDLDNHFINPILHMLADYNWQERKEIEEVINQALIKEFLPEMEKKTLASVKETVSEKREGMKNTDKKTHNFSR